MDALFELLKLKPSSKESSNSESDQKALLDEKMRNEAYENRFRARVVPEDGPLVKRSEEEIKASMDPKLYDEKYDEVVNMLEDWQRSSLEDEDYLKKEIYEKGVAYDLINNQLSSLIINNYNTFGKFCFVSLSLFSDIKEEKIPMLLSSIGSSCCSIGCCVDVMCRLLCLVFLCCWSLT